jgi:hypothetical protein
MLGNQGHPMIQTLFSNKHAVFQDESATYTQLEVFSHGLKNMKVNFIVFPGQQIARFQHH